MFVLYRIRTGAEVAYYSTLAEAQSKASRMNAHIGTETFAACHIDTSR